MSDFSFKKLTNGFSVSKDGVLRTYNGFGVSTRSLDDSIDINIEGEFGNRYEIKLSGNNITVNDVVFAGTGDELAVLLTNEVFRIATADGGDGSSGTTDFNMGTL